MRLPLPRREELATVAPAGVIGVTMLIMWEGPWHSRLLVAAVAAFAIQVFLSIIYFAVALLLSKMAGESYPSSEELIQGRRVERAVLLGAVVWAWLQLARQSDDRQFDRCVESEVAFARYRLAAEGADTSVLSDVSRDMGDWIYRCREQQRESGDYESE